MDGLKTSLTNNDLEGIQDAMSDLDGHFDDLSAKISDVGSKMNRMDVKEKIFEDVIFANTERLSKIEDADMAEAIMELKARELTYQRGAFFFGQTYDTDFDGLYGIIEQNMPGKGDALY